MTRDLLPEVVSSRARLRIATLVSARPRSLGELAAAMGISIQGVLKHLTKLEELGLVEEKNVRSPALAVRKVYVAKGVKLGDYSAEDLTLIKLRENPTAPPDKSERAFDLEYLAEETILQRRRIQDQARRLGRMIDDLMEDESRIQVALESMDLSDTERLILRVLFTEESLKEGERVLLEHFGLQDGRMPIEKTLKKVRRQTKKRSSR